MSPSAFAIRTPLVEDDVYPSVSFTSWTAGKAGAGRGGFAYDRSTEP